MKKKNNLLLRIVAMVVMTVTVLTANAQNVGDKFKEGKLYYKITKLAPKEVEVTSQNDNFPRYNNDTQKPTGEIIIPEAVNGYKVTAIGKYAFSTCKAVTSITIPESVTIIGHGAFGSCSALSKVIIPNSVTTIEGYVFDECDALTKITIPNSVTRIASYAFYDCDGLTEITIPNSITTIEAHTFRGCEALSKVVIPNSVTTIMNDAFYYCPNIRSIDIPNSVTSIGDWAFTWCNLTTFTFPESVTRIGKGVFARCSSLRSVNIPNSITSIGEKAFWDCRSLTKIYSKIEEPSKVNFEDNVFLAVKQEECTLYVPAGTLSKYQNAENWKNFENIKEMDTGIRYTKLTNPISVDGNNITVSKVAGKEVKLYSLSGQVLYNLHATQENITLSVKQAGTYILQVGNATGKIVVN